MVAANNGATARQVSAVGRQEGRRVQRKKTQEGRLGENGNRRRECQTMYTSRRKGNQSRTQESYVQMHASRTHARTYGSKRQREPSHAQLHVQ
jgi:hypothetical protein